MLRGATYLLSAALLGACTQTAIEGYADRPPSARPLSHIVAYVSGPVAIVNEAQASLTTAAEKHGVILDNAFYVLPPTRPYSDADIRRDLAAHGVDGLLLIKIGKSVTIREYAGTLLASLDAVAARGDSDFTARLLEPASGQSLWSGEGKVTVSGLLIIGNRSGPASVVVAILDELKARGLLRN
jgi:hypothetical protein